MRIRSVVAENMFQDSNNLGRDGYKVRPAEIKENKTKKTQPGTITTFVFMFIHCRIGLKIRGKRVIKIGK